MNNNRKKLLSMRIKVHDFTITARLKEYEDLISPSEKPDPFCIFTRNYFMSQQKNIFACADDPSKKRDQSGMCKL